jgi:prophage DNA circulation protein
MAPLASDGAVPSMTGATRDVLRRAALIEGARAVARYQPSSYDDAAALREAVCTWLDAEIAIAGMQGADATFESLRVLRAAVVNDLTQRGAQLSRMAPVTLNATLPASVVAQRLYQDVTRADGLIAQVDPVHPAFMPPRFMALSE